MVYGVCMKHHRHTRLAGGGEGLCYGDCVNHHRTEWGFKSGGSLCYGDSWNHHRTEGKFVGRGGFAMGIPGITIEKRKFVFVGVRRVCENKMDISLCG